METKINRKGGSKQKSEYIRLIIALVVLFGILAVFVLYLSWPLMTGKTMILETMPVDPMDLFRGQYININYEISSVPALAGAKPGDSVYVLLNKDGRGLYQYSSASLSKPEGDFIKGKVTYVYNDNMRIEYGIEQYFFERDASFPTRNITVEVKVDGSGQARISKLLQNGEPVKIEYAGQIE